MRSVYRLCMWMLYIASKKHVFKAVESKIISFAWFDPVAYWPNLPQKALPPRTSRSTMNRPPAPPEPESFTQGATLASKKGYRKCWDCSRQPKRQKLPQPSKCWLFRGQTLVKSGYCFKARQSISGFFDGQKKWRTSTCFKSDRFVFALE